MNVARIAYANTEPFFHFWPGNEFPLRLGVPKELAEAAKAGQIAAGPLPLVECWALEKDFMPLGSWGIGAREKSRSVFVLSRQPFSELDHVTIGVTKESATSVILCETLIRKKYGNDVTIRAGLHLEDAAWLVIGDQALQLACQPTLQSWSIVTDLATEWWDWKGTPFVFARWVVRRDVDDKTRERLSACVETSLRRGLNALPLIAGAVGQNLKLPPAFVETYLRGIVYEMDEQTESSERAFRELAASKESPWQTICLTS